MKLTLIPPPTLLLPPSLCTHYVDPPTEPELRSSPSAHQARDIQALRRLGVTADSHADFDKAAWWTAAVEEVAWDFESEGVVVSMRDGTSERWKSGEKGMFALSEEYVRDGDEDEIMPSQAEKATPLSGKKSSDLYDRLHALCVELRAAYEDVSTPTPGLVDVRGDSLCVDSSFDFPVLLDLSSDQTLKFPFEWSPASSQVEWFLDAPPPSESSQLSSATLNSRTPSDGDAADQEVESLLLGDRARRGQLPHRRRPTSFDLLVVDPSRRRPHDFLSFVALLTKTRATLLDLFSRYIISALHTRLPPTFAAWVGTSAEKAYLRTATRKAGELAQLFEGLLADDGNAFDPSDREEDERDMFTSQAELQTGYGDEDLESSDTDVDAEFETELGYKIWSSSQESTASRRSQESTASRRSQELKRNVLAAMRDDLALVAWCERRRGAARRNARDEGTLRMNEFISQVIPFWDVSRTYPVQGVDLLPPPIVGWDASDDNSDHDGSIDEERSIFFHPTDYTGEDLLPRRIPKALLYPARGFEMERMRKRASFLLNEIAGLQKRIMELRTFVEERMNDWEDRLELDCMPKKSGPKYRKSPLQNELKESPESDEKPKAANSMLRKSSRGTQGSSVKVRRKAAPTRKTRTLRCVTADKVIGASVQAALKDAKLNSLPGKKRPKSTSPTSPRTRKNVNLEAIGSVRALSDVGTDFRSPLGGVVATRKLRPAAARILPSPSASASPRGKKRKVEDADSDTENAPKRNRTDHASPLSFPEREAPAPRLHRADLAARRSTLDPPTSPPTTSDANEGMEGLPSTEYEVEDKVEEAWEQEVAPMSMF